MDEAAKKKALRMIPYGLYVLTSKSKDGSEVAAATINWVTQTSFHPPLVVVGVKGDSSVHGCIQDSGVFAVNVIGKEQKDIAFAFFKHNKAQHGHSISDHRYDSGPATGAPLIAACPAWWECKLVGQVDKGDHTVFVGEVLEAGVRRDDHTILMRDHNLNYGG